MSDLDNFEMNALRADAAAGEYDYSGSTDNSVTVRFLLSERERPGMYWKDRYSSATFEDASVAYSFVHAAVRAGTIVCLSTVTGPGADEYDRCSAAAIAAVLAETESMIDNIR